ncbi:radical SAM/SPASM domain-containing protein [Geobacter sp.]|uniref:radical SAM/SPASM domain-containing protein n=1 Tax=Geobacter sp. TaxID=46610 RepID=UPI0027B91DB3|nr:radical SAM protein [Geobacter sp.]
MNPTVALDILREKGLLPPETLTLAITGTCNLRCHHCWVDAGSSGTAPAVPTRTLLRLLEEFGALGGGGVRFTGGEPLCHPGWLELVRSARAIGYRSVSLQTNGMLFTEHNVAALKELDFPGLAIQISLDGATAPIHDLVRGRGAFAGALDGIRRLRDGGLGKRITLFMTEMRHNLEEIPALLHLASELEIGSAVTGSLVRCGRAAQDSPVAPPTLEQYELLLRRFDSDPSFRELYERIGNVAALEWRRETAPRTECCAFVQNPYLTPDGRLYPCVLCHVDRYAVFGVLQKDLASAFVEGAPLWDTLKKMSQCRAGANAACRECPGRLTCAGGCMGRAWASSGALLAVDDRCEVRQALYRQNSSLASTREKHVAAEATEETE